MTMQNNKNRIRVDYLKEEKERALLMNYLRTGNFRKITGEGLLGIRIQRRRTFVVLAAVLNFLTGLLFMIF